MLITHTYSRRARPSSDCIHSWYMLWILWRCDVYNTTGIKTFARGSLFVPIRLRNILDFTGTHTLYIEKTLNTSIFLLLILNLSITKVLNLKILFFGLKFGKSLYNSLINAYVTDCISVQRCCVRPKTGLHVLIYFISEWISYRMSSNVNPFKQSRPQVSSLI